MKNLVDKFARKIVQAGLADNPLVCGLDDELVWNRSDPAAPMLAQVVANMRINSLICAEPAEPYRSILRFLCRNRPATINPQDCETRTFLHDLPVTDVFSADAVLSRLRYRKSVIICDEDKVRVISFGTVSPEQAFVTLSSVCFSTFVLFFSRLLEQKRAGSLDDHALNLCERIRPLVTPPARKPPRLATGPFSSIRDAAAAMVEAGRQTVNLGLVDSYFGNISCRLEDTICISQTGSSLDELARCIDPCPLDGSSCTGITASSELTAHNEIYLSSTCRTIVHGHPKFVVILSMACDRMNCPNRGQCHVRCDRARFIEDIPIVPGEVGTGPTGLCHTLPPAIRDRRGAIVWGHGLFTTGKIDFNEPLAGLLAIEQMCRRIFFEEIGATG